MSDPVCLPPSTSSICVSFSKPERLFFLRVFSHTTQIEGRTAFPGAVCTVACDLVRRAAFAGLSCDISASTGTYIFQQNFFNTYIMLAMC